MYLIVGLGNPEKEYSNTRHNIGFDVVNEIAKRQGMNISQNKFKGEYGSGTVGNKKVILLKPQTYMNNSGESIIEIKNFYKIPNENIIVIYDDMDLDVGTIKLRKSGGPGNHNGLKSVVKYIGEQFYRIRIGIGKPVNSENVIQYVIGKIPKDEMGVLQEKVKVAADAVVSILEDGIDKAMNKFNVKSGKDV